MKKIILLTIFTATYMQGFQFGGKIHWPKLAYSKKNAKIKKLNKFLTSQDKTPEQLHEWLTYAIEANLRPQVKSLLKAGALEGLSMNAQGRLLSSAFNNNNLDNFKRLLIYGADYKSILDINALDYYRPDAALFIKALIDFGLAPCENKPKKNDNLLSLRESASRNLGNVVNKNKKLLIRYLQAYPYCFYDIIAKSLSDYGACTHQPLLVFKQIAYAKKKLSKEEFLHFVDFFDRRFIELRDERYKTIQANKDTCDNAIIKAIKMTHNRRKTSKCDSDTLQDCKNQIDETLGYSINLKNLPISSFEQVYEEALALSQ